jgi:fumarate hydratase subunit beta
MKSFEKTIVLKTPLSSDDIQKLKAGDIVSLSGRIFSARDAAHKRILSAIAEGIKLPVEIEGRTVMYLGPSPTPPGKASGSIGPTTSARMDEFTEPLLEKGLKAAIGKGARSDKTRGLFLKHGAIYFVACGGIGAYLAQKVKGIEPIAYRDLGAEAIYMLEVKDFPLIVAYDIHGGDIFKTSQIL